MIFARGFRLAALPLAFAGFLVAFLAASPAAAAVCGNGTVEAGEQCDDGSQNGGTNSCCTSACTLSGKAPDVIVGDLPDVDNTFPTIIGGIRAYSVGTTSCNLGSCWLNWFANTAQKPIIGQNMYRLKNGRFEHIGQSWLKHAFTALQGSVCSSSCVSAPSGAHLGVNCSDPYSAGLNAGQSRLGPKSDVDANTGVYLFPDSRISTTGDAIFKRLQVHTTDLDPAQNAGALYFVEGQYVTLDDASAKNQNNNASYRRITVAAASPFNITLADTTQRQKPGIQAWKAADPTVTETNVPANEGLFILSAKATSLGGGVYHYEYAIQNLTNNRGAQAFTVPIPPGTVVTNVGFHDVDYHSGEPFNGTDWTSSVSATSVNWTTVPWTTNPNANALRWGTLYNFRFDANVGPGSAPTVIDLFKPGGAPNFATAVTVAPNSCFGVADGAACNDGSLCTQTDTCQAGVCAGASPVVCTASDACHTAGTCAPATGLCSNPNAPNGTACNDANACTQSDTCQTGVCTGGNPVVCTASDQCHDIGTCGPLTGVCSNPVKANGSACNDGNGCTQTDTCQAGLCLGNNPKVCSASDQCHVAGTCAPGTGLCSNPAKADGSTCNDANGCTQTDTCLSGLCTGANPVTCTASDQCHTAGTCDTGTGACSNPQAPDGTACSDGNGCTVADACAGGACASGAPVVCTPSNACHGAGTCDSGTGLCSDPVLADGTACTDGNSCTLSDACSGGTCAGGSPVVCTASDGCHEAGTCNPANGSCSNPARADGTPCDDANACTTADACTGGVCAGTGGATPGSVDNGVLVTMNSGVATISWNPAVGSSWSAVLRGLVSQLPVGPGAGDEVCLDSAVAGASTTDAQNPNADEAFWYLIKGVNACGAGSYGTSVKDGLTEQRTSSTCP